MGEFLNSLAKERGITDSGITLDESEQSIVTENINLNPSNYINGNVQTSLGLTSIPQDLIDGTIANIASVPSTIYGAQTQKFGESALQNIPKSERGGFFNRMKTSFIMQVARDDETQPFDAILKGWNSVGDAAITGGEEPIAEVIKDAGFRLVQENKAWMQESGLLRENPSLAYKVGGGAASILPTMLLTIASKDPKIASAYIGSLVNSQSYLEARDSGQSIDDSIDYAARNTLASGAIEYFGGEFLLGAIKGSGFVKASLLGIVGQAGEEGSQSLAEDVLAKQYGIRDKTYEEIFLDAGEQMLIGAIVGAPVSTVTSAIETRNKKRGIQENLTQDILKKYLENQGEIFDVAAAFIDKETSGLGLSKYALKQTKAQVERIIAENEARIEEQGGVKSARSAMLLEDYAQTTKEAFLLRSKESRTQEEAAALGGIFQKQEKLRRQIDERLNEQISDLELQTLRDVQDLRTKDGAPINEVLLNATDNYQKATNELNRTRKPRRLSAALKKIGGLKESKGELKNMGITSRTKLLNNKTGMNLDEATDYAIQEGFLPADATIGDFLSALSDDFNDHNPIYSSAQDDLVAKINALSEFIESTERALSEAGIDPNESIAEAKKILKGIKKKKQSIEKIQAKVQENIENAPNVFADALKTFKSGLRRGRILQKKETAAVQKEFKRIIESSKLEAADKAILYKKINSIQTIEQFEKQADELISRAREMHNKSRIKKSRERLKKLVSKKRVAPTKQSGKPKGKFLPDASKLLNSLREIVGLTQEKAGAYYAANSNTGVPPTSEQAILNKVAAIIANKDLDAFDTEMFVEDLETFIKGEKAIYNDTILRRQDELAGLKLAAAKALDANQTIALYDRKSFKQRIANSANNMRAVANGWLYGWYDIPDIVFGQESLLVEKLRVNTEINTERKIRRQMNESIESAYKASFGFSKKSAVARQMAEDSKVINIGKFTDASGDAVNLQMTKQEMRKLYMELQDPTLQETLFSKEGNAYTQEMVNAIKNELTPADINFAKEQMAIYQKFYNEVNAVYKQIYQVDLPFNPYYSPIRREVDSEFQTDEFMQDIAYRDSVGSGALKNRVQNIRKIQTRSDMAVFQRHVAEMSHFIAFAEKMQEINAVFGNATIRKAIKIKHGDSFVEIIDEYIGILTRNGARNGDALDRIVNTLNRNYAVSVLGGKVALAAKQMTAFVAYADEVPVKDFMVGVTEFLVNPRKAIKILGKTELMQSRGVSIEQDLAAMGKALDWEILRRKQKFDNVMMSFIKFGDRASIYMGGWAYYKYQLKQGLTQEQALAKFEEKTDSTQQSSAVDQVSLLQTGGAMRRTMTMFLSAPAAYLRAELRAIRNYRRGNITKAQLTKKLALYHFVLPMFFQYVASGFDFEEDKQAQAAILGNLNGFFILGDLLSRAVAKAFGTHYFEGEPHFAAWAGEIANGISDAITSSDTEDFIEAIKDIASGAGKALGAPVDAVKGTAEGVDNAEEDPQNSILRIFGWPASVAFPKDDDEE